MGVRYEVEDGIAKVTLDRPGFGNTLDEEGASLLHDIIERAANDYSRVVLVSAVGDTFCEGVDLTALSRAQDRASHHLELSSVLESGLRLLGSMPKPVVAAVRGRVAGAGLAILLSCDLVVADNTARFALGYTAEGLTPDSGVSWLLPRAIGQQRALEMALTDRELDTGTALDWGLVTHAVADGELEGRSWDVARIVAEGPSWAYGQARRLIRRSWESTRDEIGGDEAVTAARAVIMPDARTAPGRMHPR